MFTNSKSINPEFIRKQLINRKADPYIFPDSEFFVPGPPRPAAVLIPLIKKNGDWELLFIRRTKVEGDHHSGQVAFPGGRTDDNDPDPETTALRETQEEIGVKASSIDVLGQLEYMVTISNYKVTPVVGHMQWPIKLSAQKNEVDRIFSIPLAWLTDKKNHRIEKRKIDKSSQSHPVIYFNEYDGESLWGVTAHIVLNFLEALSSSSE